MQSLFLNVKFLLMLVICLDCTKKQKQTEHQTSANHMQSVGCVFETPNLVHISLIYEEEYHEALCLKAWLQSRNAISMASFYLLC